MNIRKSIFIAFLLLFLGVSGCSSTKVSDGIPLERSEAKVAPPLSDLDPGQPKLKKAGFTAGERVLINNHRSKLRADAEAAEIDSLTPVISYEPLVDNGVVVYVSMKCLGLQKTACSSLTNPELFSFSVYEY